MSHHMQWRGRIPLRSVAVVSCLLASLTKAHEHHMDNIAEGEGISAEPIVRALHLAGHYYDN
jgi:hypothetical protein